MAKRRKFTPEQKVKILRRHLVEKVPVSEICDKHGIKPAMFYRWQKEFFENGAAAFKKASDAQARKMQRQMEAMKERIVHKDGVIAEIIESHIALKKSLGED
ncbi:MAG: transposase [Deltaproteobacteria bacterium]|nr:transposase [Deltaproteobacteria bacterium]